MPATDPATDRQVKLIESLYEQLHIRDTSLYGGTELAHLTKQRASEAIDVLTLRKLSGQLGRPVTADLTDPAQVREQLACVEQLTDAHHTRHAPAGRPAWHSRDSNGPSGEITRHDQQRAKRRARVLPHRTGRQAPQPRVELSPEQLAARAGQLDRDHDGRLDGASRYSDVTGYGSTASYRTNGSCRDSDASQLTDDQERQIIELQHAGDDERVMNTILEASEYLDQELARPEPPPTQRQLAYLHALEKQTGRTDELTHPGTRQGASRRIERLLEAKSAPEEPCRDPDLAASLALTGAAAPHNIQEVRAEAAASTTRNMPSVESSALHHVGNGPLEHENERDS